LIKKIIYVSAGLYCIIGFKNEFSGWCKNGFQALRRKTKIRAKIAVLTTFSTKHGENTLWTNWALRGA
jgi:hypothetical protein